MAEYQRGYSRGYSAGVRGKWPDHQPPMPPEANVAEMMEALRALRSEIDSKLATLEEKDPWNEDLGPLISRADGAMRNVTTWLLTGPYEKR